jgi:hypothetical protein
MEKVFKVSVRKVLCCVLLSASGTLSGAWELEDEGVDIWSVAKGGI